MLENKKDWKSVTFRVILIATFVIGLLYVFQFISLGIKSESIEKDEFLELCGRWANTYYLYFAASLLSLIMSVVSFRSTGKVVSVIRTFFLFLASLLLFAAMNTMNIFKKATGVDLDDWDEVLDLYHEINHLTEDEATVSILITLCVIIIFFELCITSIVFLVRKKKN